MALEQDKKESDAREKEVAGILNSIENDQKGIRSNQEDIAATMKLIQAQAQSAIDMSRATQKAIALMTGEYAYVANVDVPESISPEGRWEDAKFTVRSLVPRQVRGRIVGVKSRGPVCQVVCIEGEQGCSCPGKLMQSFTIEPESGPQPEDHLVRFQITFPDEWECRSEYTITYFFQVQQPNGGYKNVDRYVLKYRHDNHRKDRRCKKSTTYTLDRRTIWGTGSEAPVTNKYPEG